MASLVIMAVASGMLNLRAVPLATECVHAGFPSPADDHRDDNLDLGRRFIRQPNSTFIVVANGDSLSDMGIYSGDYLVVDRSRSPRHGNVIIAVIDGSFAAKLFMRRGEAIILESAKASIRPIPWRDGYEVWGIVTSVHRDLIGQHAYAGTD